MSLYLGWVFLFVGYRSDHLPFMLILGSMYLLTEGTHKFFLGFFGLTLSWILLDSLRVFPSYLYNDVHIEDIYHAEKALFGIQVDGVKMTLNEYFRLHNSPILDFITGFTYLMWTPFPVALGIYLFITDRNLLLRFTMGFFLANVIGVFIYYTYPAAPPWYVELYGFERKFDIPGSAAGLLSFDKMTGTHIFEGIYSKSFNVFGAIPSLHSAYPIIAVYYAWKKRMKIGLVILFIFMLMTWFSAVYSIHHYLVDVVLGIFCAIFAIVILEQIILRSSIKKLIDKLSNYINP